MPIIGEPNRDSIGDSPPQKTCGWRIAVHTAVIKFTPKQKREILMIVKEIMTNVDRHADATEFKPHLRCESRKFRLEAGDNGKGFDPDKVAPDSQGLSDIRERASGLNAELELSASPGRGTRHSISLPL